MNLQIALRRTTAGLALVSALALGSGASLLVQPQAAKTSPRSVWEVGTSRVENNQDHGRISDHNNRRNCLSCPDSHYILAAEEAAGLSLPYYCRAGDSRTCAGLITSGSDDQSEQKYSNK